MGKNSDQQLMKRFGLKIQDVQAVNELIGMAKGIISDSVVNQVEAEFLLSWMETNVSFCEDRTISHLYCRIHEMLADGFLDNNEQLELFDILRDFSGESSIKRKATLASHFPLCRPAPSIEFPTMTFCLTGKFAYGPRRICEEVVLERGGKISDIVSSNTNYLVIGTFANPSWAHSSFGRKIERAMGLREQHGQPAIISEDHWSLSAFSM